MAGKSLLHLMKVVAGLDEPRTQTTSNERKALASYSSQAQLAVEIGVFEGYNTALIARSIPEDAVLFGIDPFFKGKLGICYEKFIAKTQIAKFRVGKKVKLIEKLSFDALGDVPDNIDFIFVDGDHSWKGIERDWQDWSKKLRVGGVIALHDTTKYYTWFDPKESIEYFNKVIIRDISFELLETVDSTNILRKTS